MTQDHPIIPPPELVEQWCYEDGDEIKTSPRWYQIVATKAAHWGADMELEACCEWLRESLATPSLVECFRAARRPKPPTLKKQALEALPTPSGQVTADRFALIRRALEALPDD